MPPPSQKKVSVIVCMFQSNIVCLLSLEAARGDTDVPQQLPNNS